MEVKKNNKKYGATEKYVKKWQNLGTKGIVYNSG